MSIPAGFSFTLSIWQTFAILALFVWVYCLVDIVRHEFKNNSKTTWLLIVFFSSNFRFGTIFIHREK